MWRRRQGLSARHPLYRLERAVLTDLLYHNLFWRNTKESIAKTDWSIPPTVSELVLVDPTPIEAVLLADAEGDEERQRRICCDLRREFGDLKNLEAIRIKFT